MKKSNNLPSISILIPTLNSERTLEECLSSIKAQDYPKERLEIIIADGGSTDKTLKIIQNSKFKMQSASWRTKFKIINNPLKTGEAGKAVALRHARGELVTLIDSDNVLPDKDWLKKMVEPFSDPEIIGSEPWEFIERKTDGFIDRYCALLGMNDPLCLFLGNYDKRCVLTGRWTDLPIEQEDKGNWLKITLKKGMIPTIGANGTIFRTIHLQGIKATDYLVDIDIISGLAAKKPIKFAKVKSGIIHLYCGSNIKIFIRKQRRRIQDYLFFQRMGLRQYPWQRLKKLGLFKFIFFSVTMLPLIGQSLKGFIRKPDPAWFFHPFACWITLVIYGFGVIKSLVNPRPLDRKNWGQEA